MRSTLILVFLLAIIPFSGFGQAEDDVYEANRLKKLFPDDRVAAVSVEEEYNFERGKGNDRLPVVTATKNTGITFISLRESASIQ